VSSSVSALTHDLNDVALIEQQSAQF